MADSEAAALAQPLPAQRPRELRGAGVNRRLSCNGDGPTGLPAAAEDKEEEGGNTELDVRRPTPPTIFTVIIIDHRCARHVPEFLDTLTSWASAYET